jgi:hypothetical protein
MALTDAEEPFHVSGRGALRSQVDRLTLGDFDRWHIQLLASGVWVQSCWSRVVLAPYREERTKGGVIIV